MMCLQARSSVQSELLEFLMKASQKLCLGSGNEEVVYILRWYVGMGQ